MRRLDQILSRYGYCSRSEARAWIRAGRVRVGDDLAEAPDEKASPEKVRIDNEPIECPDGILALLHKPADHVCSRDAREGPNVFELLPPRWSQRNPPITTIGRLDKDTTGALLVTDLGELVQRWTSPKHKVPKVYDVTVSGDLRQELSSVFASGQLLLEGESKPCLPAKLEIINARTANVELIEGRYHQVKRMFASQGYEVTGLHRNRFGEYRLDGLAPGQWRILPLPG